jgi:hypothetical protein
MLRSKRRGGVIIMVAAASAFLIGAGAWVVDMATGLAARTRDQAAADAAALAGAYHLAGVADLAGAKAVASDYAARNGAVVTADNVNTWAMPTGSQAITVKATREVPTTFARFFGMTSMSVKVASSASLRGLAELPAGSVPFGIPAYQDPNGNWKVLASDVPGDYRPLVANPPTQLDLEVSPRCTPEGSFLPLSMDRAGLDEYRDNIANGTSKPLPFNTRILTEAGSDATPTIQGLRQRVAAGKTTMIVALIRREDWETSEFRSEATVIGAMAVQIDSIETARETLYHAHYKPIVMAATPAAATATARTPGVYTPVLIDTPGAQL